MIDLSDKTVAVIGNGLESCAAERLARDVGRLIYWIPWVSSFPTSHLRHIGDGLEGVERVDYIWDYADQIDLWVFLDCNFGDMQTYLRQHGHRVWGAGKAEELELFRWSAKEFQKQAGLPVQPCRIITGIPALREYLQKLTKGQKVHVKLSQTRGDDESYAVSDYEQVRPRLDDFQLRLGPVSDIYEFIVEDDIPDSQEYGYDGFNIDGQWPKTACFGFEQKDQLYCGTVLPYDKLPKGAQTVNEALSPLFKKYGYRGFYSSEIREKVGKAYLIDSTARNPVPPGECYLEWWDNYAEILWEGAGGNLVDIKPCAPYVFEFILYAEQAAKHWQAVKYPREMAKFVKLFNHTRINGTDWIVPTKSRLVQIGGVLGFGQTMQEAHDQAVEHADQVEGDSVEILTESVPKLWETIRAGAKNGIYFGDSPIPA